MLHDLSHAKLIERINLRLYQGWPDCSVAKVFSGSNANKNRHTCFILVY